MSIGWLDFGIVQPGWLNFGRTAVPDNELTIQATLLPVSGTLSFFIGFRLSYTVSARNHGTREINRDLHLAHDAGLVYPVQHSVIWESALQRPQPVTLVHHAGLPVPSFTAMRWSDGQPRAARDSIPWSLGTPFFASRSSVFHAGMPIRQVPVIPWSAGLSSPRFVASPMQSGISLRFIPSIHWTDGRSDPGTISIVWDNGRPAPHGWRPSVMPLPTDGKLWGRLNFVCPAGSFLNFGSLCFGSAMLAVPIRRSYRVINSAALIRVSDSADIPVSNLTVGIDWESWCWTLSATLMNRTGYERVPAAPGLVQATINGFVWRFVVDEVDYSRAFNDFGGQLTGRSPIALMAEPYSLAKSYWETSTKTAQQLMLQELPEGYSLSVSLPDWTVPAGVFKYENLTPMEALIRIAKSCGGKVYAHKTDQTLYAVPKWPRKPWDWLSSPATVTLPSSYTLKENLKQQEGFEYEAIMVSGGVDSGIVAICKRAATGGLTHAPSVVDTLITHLDAAEPRAIQELADQWPMKRYTLELPLQATPAGAGLIEPGIVLDFADGEEDGWRGLVTGVTINATWDSVQQTVEVVAP
jgi:hypothetical protein